VTSLFHQFIFFAGKPLEIIGTMKQIPLILLLAASAGAAIAQTAAKPAPHVAAKTAATATKSSAVHSGIKLPPGVPPGRGLVKTAFSLRYQDLKVGTGPEAEPGKIYKVHYTGWLGANGRPDDGRKFDSSYDHRMPVMGKDGKPVLDDDGKPKLGDPQPLSFPQGYGRLIPGFDQGVVGMRVGGKRRIFIPWQLAYGAMGRPGPDPAHPGIPAKANLIFDVELLDVTDLPAMPNRPMMNGVPGGRSMPQGMPAHPAAAAPATPQADHGTAAPATSAPAQAQPAAPAQPK
jgi:peptidylprolyl isomerase